VLSKLAATVAVLATVVVGSASRADAADPVSCLPGTQVCVVQVTQPGTQPSAGTPNSGVVASTGQRVCTVPATGAQVSCFDPVWGWWNDQDGCYWKLADPQPADNVWWEGHYPNGAIWDVLCFPIRPGSSAGGWTWRASPPPGYGGTSVTPAQLAQQAVDQMTLLGPEIHLSIPADKFATVGVPVWLWTGVTPATWGPNSATAAVPGLSVTATAQARQIVWDTGDGLSETCRNPGTAYYAGGVTSPTCQHVYQRSSAEQPGLAYPIRATTTWDVTWTGGGASGSLTVTRVSTGQIRVGEVQVLVTTS